MAEVVIRAAVASDAVMIGKLWERLVAYHLEIDDDMPRAALNGGEVYARNVRERIDDSHMRVYVAESDGLIVGYALGLIVDRVPEMFAPEAGGFLGDIYVEEGYRSQGIGHNLVAAMRSWFREHGLTYFEWHVTAENEGAMRFWQELGGRYVQIRMRAEIEDEADD